MRTRLFALSIRATICSGLGIIALAFASSASATLVTWDLNPGNQNASLGSSSHTYTVNGFSITAYGFNNVIGGPDTPHTLYYKNTGGGFDHGLGITGTSDNELQNDHGTPLQYIQFDFASILALGFTNGQLAASSVDPGEGWTIYGSNTLGSLGTNLNAAGYGDTTNNLFVNIPGFGNYRYYSVVSTIDDVLPFGFQAFFNPVPEIGGLSAGIVLVGFVGLVVASRAIRTRRLS